MKNNNWETIHFLENFEVTNSSDLVFLFQILRKNMESKNYLLRAEIMTCIIDNNINSNEITQYALKCLIDKSNYIVKLSALDYLVKNRSQFNNSEIQEISESLNVIKNNRLKIIKNQVYFTFILFDTSNKISHFNELLISLNNTDDYRSFIRIYNTIINYDLKKEFEFQHIDELIKITKGKDFGLSVESAIQRVKNYFTGGGSN